MADVNIDVVSAGSARDFAILSVRNEIEGELVANSVSDMVNKIENKLRGNLIGRLRMFGHGGPGLACIGNVPTTLSLESPEQVLERHSLNTIRVVRHILIDEQGQRRGEQYPMLNEPTLRRLSGKFSASGWAEIHACNVAAGDRGEALLKGLAQMWNVLVKGGTGIQVAGGGIENTVVIAYPNGRITTRAPRTAPSAGGCSIAW